MFRHSGIKGMLERCGYIALLHIIYGTFVNLLVSKFREPHPKGRSLVPLLQDSNQNGKIERFSHRGRWGGGGKETPGRSKVLWCIRCNTRWRLCSKWTAGPWLSDISKDPGETKNLIKVHPGVAKE